jgi:hypothetical protein
VTSISRWLLASGASLALVLSGVPAASAGQGGDAASGGPPTTPRSPASAAIAAALDRADSGAAVGAINPADYICGPTEFTEYSAGLARSLSPEENAFVREHPEILAVATFDAILFGSATDPRYELRGDYRQALSKTFSKLQGFWDIPSADIKLISMDGDVLQDPVRIARVLQQPLPPFGFSPEAAEQEALEISTAIRGGLFSGGENPLLTLNAFAFTPALYPFPVMKDLPDVMIIGDGMVDVLNALGVGDVGPRVVMAHEFGHYVQYRKGIFASSLPQPEASRRTELMADAFSTYFAVHARGLTLNAKRVLEAERVFFDLGDCAYTNPAHHGTPLQRMRSATWAAGVATAARPQGKVLPSLTFAAMFERELPVLVAPDAR